MSASPTPNSEETIFYAAAALSGAEREAYLAEKCRDVPGLRARVDRLLRAHVETGNLVDAGIGAALRDALEAGGSEDQPGVFIGRYRLLQKIGEGGCGAVYQAEQLEPLRRRVAVKVIKLGMDTKEVIARFEAERQALAMMDHPNIAQVFDAGTTAQGRPFFVMELVHGISVTRYCDEHNLPTAARLALFIQICHAVQHAHQKGIIHRDLKPSNILVALDGTTPIPKVIDFGIAKAAQGRLTDRTLFTAFEQFIGTPAYMSPEQAELSSLDVDTRSDIYSLGVLLYELLTGQTPFDPKSLGQAGLDEIRRIIREVEPPRPSARLSTLTEADRATIARLRNTGPAQLSVLLNGDLDWIVMRCLEKDRRRRYETAQVLALDLQRYLDHEPVAARPPTTAYFLQKLLRRHRLAVGAGLAIALALLAGTGVSTWQAVRATHAETLAAHRLLSELTARQEAEHQQQLALDRLGAEQTARQETEGQKVLAEQERNRARAAEKLADDRLQTELAERREVEQQKILAEQQRARAEQQQAVAETERNHAQASEKKAQAEAARNAEAARLMQAMLKGAGPHIALLGNPRVLHDILDQATRSISREPPGPARTELADALTAVYYDLGDYITSTAIGGKWAGTEHPTLGPALGQLGAVFLRRDRLENAEAVLREALAVDRLVSIAGNGQADSADVLANLREVLRREGKPSEAVPSDQERVTPTTIDATNDVPTPTSPR